MSDEITPEMVKQFIKDIRDMMTEREKIIALCNRHAQPGVNTQTHEVCYRILQILGEREVSK